ncbi:MAG: hypothetical protein ABIJ30_12435, partial [bacterium]
MKMYERLKAEIQKDAIWKSRLLIGIIMLGMMLCIPNAFATSTTNLLITDGNNHRVIEVDPITHNVIWQYGQSGVIG